MTTRRVEVGVSGRHVVSIRPQLGGRENLQLCQKQRGATMPCTILWWQVALTLCYPDPGAGLSLVWESVLLKQLIPPLLPLKVFKDGCHSEEDAVAQVKSQIYSSESAKFNNE